MMNNVAKLVKPYPPFCIDVLTFSGVLSTEGVSYPFRIAPLPLIVILLFTYIEMSLYSPASKFNVSPSDKPSIFDWMSALLEPAVTVSILGVEPSSA